MQPTWIPNVSPHVSVSIVSMIATHPWHEHWAVLEPGWWPALRPGSADPGHCNSAHAKTRSQDVSSHAPGSDSEQKRFWQSWGPRPLHRPVQAMAGLRLTLLITDQCHEGHAVSCYDARNLCLLFSSSLMWQKTLTMLSDRLSCHAHSPHLVSPAARPWPPWGCMRWCPPCPWSPGSPLLCHLSCISNITADVVTSVHVVSSADWLAAPVWPPPAPAQAGAGTEHPSAWPALAWWERGHTGPQHWGPSLLTTGIIATNHWHQTDTLTQTPGWYTLSQVTSCPTSNIGRAGRGNQLCPPHPRCVHPLSRGGGGGAVGHLPSPCPGLIRCLSPGADQECAVSD